MKKILALLLVLVMALSIVGCVSNEDQKDDNTDPTTEATEPVVESGVMDHDAYMAAELDAEVVVECYVQGHQSWWDNKITVYAQDDNGGYFMYEMACSEEDAAKLVAGTKIRVTGYKAEWAGEVEIVDATFEIIEGDTKVYEAADVTALLGTDELAAHQNEFVAMNGLTVVSVEYKNGEPGDDIYLKVSLGEQTYDLCVERYLTGPETDVYAAVGALQAGNVINVEGFLYWYEGPNPHITAVTVQ